MTGSDKKGAVAAFFDLDLTLIGLNSARHWMEHEQRQGRLSRKQLAEGMVWLIGYKFGLLNAETGILRAIAGLKGLPEDVLSERMREWYEMYIKATLLSQGRDTVEDHRRQRHHLVLLTGTSSYVSKLVQSDLGLDHVLCTQFEVKDGLLTGRAVHPVCYGQGKVRWAESWAKTQGVSLRKSYFYTDSASDLPMLEAVGHPFAVNPDPRLRRLARRRGWPIEDWK